jgi:hypothetical protein
MKSRVIALLWLAAAACADDAQFLQDAAGSPTGELADFRSLTMGSYAPCGGPKCGESFRLDASGAFVHEHFEQQFEAQLASSDLEPIVRLASSRAVIEELRKIPGCPGVPDGGEGLVIEIATGLFVSGDIGGCVEGPLVALRGQLRALAKRLFPASRVTLTPLGMAPTNLEPFRLTETLKMMDFYLDRRWGPCPPMTRCLEIISVDSRLEIVSSAGVGKSRRFDHVTDFSPLDSVAISPPVVAELRKPSPCPAVTDVTETIGVWIGPRLAVRASTAGCASGPIADLRTAARALVDRLSADPVPDAAPADHPADLLPP